VLLQAELPQKQLTQAGVGQTEEVQEGDLGSNKAILLRLPQIPAKAHVVVQGISPEILLKWKWASLGFRVNTPGC